MSATRVDPWKAAADCERALRMTNDPRQRELLGYLRGLWISLASESPYLTSAELAEDTEAVIQIQMHADTDMRTSGTRH